MVMRPSAESAGQIALLHMFEGTGSVARDYGRPAILPGIAYSDRVAGKFTNAISCNGTLSKVGWIPSYGEINFTGDFTIEFWVYVPTSQVYTTNGDNDIIEKWNGSGAYPYVIRYNTTAGSFYFAQYNGTTSASATSKPGYNTNSWHHVAAVKSGTNLYIYVDGNLDGTGTSTLGACSNTNSVCLFYRNSTPEINFYTGRMCELRFWNLARSQAQIQSAMNTQLAGNELGLVGYFKMDEGSGVMLRNSTSFNYRGAINGNPSWVDGKFGKTINFDGVDDWILAYGQTRIAPSYVTVEAWIKTTAGSGIIFSKKARAYGGWQAYCLGIGIYGSSAGKLACRLQQTSTPTFIDIASTITVNDGLPHHVAMTFDTDYKVRLYIDGVLNTTSSAGTGPIYYYVTDRDGIIGAARYAASGDGADTGTESYFNGQIEDVRVWGYARTQQQIQSNMNVQLTGLEDKLLTYWKFKEGTSNISWTLDSVPFRNSGNITGATYVDTPWGKGLNFRGGTNNDRVVIPYHISLLPQTRAITTEMLVYIPQMDTAYGVLISKDYTSHATPYYSFHLRLDSGQTGTSVTNPAIWAYILIGSTGYQINVTNKITINKWYHIVLTYDNAYLRLYLNGVEIGNVACTGTITDYATEWYIGTARNFTTGCFKGQIAFYNILGREMPAKEVAFRWNQFAKVIVG